MMYPYLDAKNVKEICRLIGAPEHRAPIVDMRRSIIWAIRGVLKKKGLTQAEAAGKAKVGRTVITSIYNGQVAKISTDKMLDVALRLGIKFNFEMIE